MASRIAKNQVKAPGRFRADPALIPDVAETPGEFLLEELRAREMTQKELAFAMGRPGKLVNEIVRGKKTITAETALQLQDALGISAYFWLNKQSTWDLVQARDRRRGTRSSA
jgi:HTH-type transcriptional regulator/antitoxin HigA